jgi:hypothetical protein
MARRLTKVSISLYCYSNDLSAQPVADCTIPLALPFASRSSQELADMQKAPLDWATCGPKDDDILTWTAMLVGPVSSTPGLAATSFRSFIDPASCVLCALCAAERCCSTLLIC